MRLIQFERENGARAVAATTPSGTHIVTGYTTILDLANAAIAADKPIAEIVAAAKTGDAVDVEKLAAEGRLLAPIDHPEPARCFVTGTGITHLGSAEARNALHAKLGGTAPGEMSDSMKMFKMGLDGGKPAAGKVGVQPEWFYKGDGSCVVRPGAKLAMPDFAEAGGEEAEIVGIYVVAPDGSPRRIGFAISNEFADHVVERQNYLYGAHSKLRSCSIGPELLLGDLPADVRGHSRVLRDGKKLWEGEFFSGEANMSHSIANLEHHHFKYAMFRRPGDVHCHFFGAAVFSFAHGIRCRPGDVFEIDVPIFGAPLRNALAVAKADTSPVRAL